MSKYTFFNKIISDDKLIVDLVGMIHRRFGYNFETSPEKVTILLSRFKDDFKINIFYKVYDFSEGWVKEKYGLKKDTDLYIIHQNDSYQIVINEKNNYNDNRFMILKAIGYILLDQLPNKKELRLTKDSTISNWDILAEHFAIEFILPKWKLKYFKTTDANELSNAFLSFNKRLAELRLKY